MAAANPDYSKLSVEEVIAKADFRCARRKRYLLRLELAKYLNRLQLGSMTATPELRTKLRAKFPLCEASALVT